MKSQALTHPQAEPFRLSRRNFLRLTAAVGVTAAAGYLYYESAPWLDYEQQAGYTWRPLAASVNTGTKELSTMNGQRLELVRYATLAANGHNTQPWKFAIGDNTIEIHPDYTRRLPVVDPTDRELWISLGCALENLLIAARVTGYATEVVYPEKAEVIQVRLRPDAAQTSPLFDAIPHRQNTRSEYDGRLIKNVELDQLQALPLEPGVSLRFALNPNEMATVTDYVSQGNLQQYADPAFVDELIAWLRFNKKEALNSLDGLYSASSGNPQVPRWLGQLVLGRTNPQQQADSDLKKLRTSPSAVVIASTADDRATWVRTGQVYERLALQMTALNIKSAFLNQPIEVASLRSQFQSALGLNGSLPQLLVRFGYANEMPRSLRRPVEQVMIA